MIIVVVLLLIVYFIYKLLTNSLTYKWLFGIFGWFGMYWALTKYIPNSNIYGIIINSYCITWAAIIPSMLVILALIITRD